MGQIDSLAETMLKRDRERRRNSSFRNSRRDNFEACPHCGQTLPDPLPYGLKLPGIIQGRILKFVHKAGKHGIRSDYLLEKVYSIFPDGGPVTARRALHVAIWQLNNRHLKPYGLMVRAKQAGHYVPRYYFLRKLDD